LTAPQFRRNGEARQDSELHERKEGKNVRVDRNQPLTRPAAADENAVAVHPLPQGGEGIGSEAGPCQESGLYDRGFVLKEQATNATACSRSCCWLSALERRLLFSSTFPVRSLVFSESARRRGRACSICVYFTGRVKSPQSGRSHLAHGEPAVGSVENRSFAHRAPYGVASAWLISRVDGGRCRPSRGWVFFLGRDRRPTAGSPWAK